MITINIINPKNQWLKKTQTKAVMRRTISIPIVIPVKGLIIFASLWARTNTVKYKTLYTNIIVNTKNIICPSISLILKKFYHSNINNSRNYIKVVKFVD